MNRTLFPEIEIYIFGEEASLRRLRKDTENVSGN